jgi:hypothetical protein
MTSSNSQRFEFSLESSAVRITNVSKDRMRVHIATPVQRGSPVKVKVKTSLLFGECRQCEPVRDDFFCVAFTFTTFSLLSAGGQVT